MSKVEFIFEGQITEIQCNLEEKMEEIMNKFSKKFFKKIEDLCFLYSGRMINPNLTFFNQANEEDKKRNIMTILVIKPEDTNINEQQKKSKYIICPECKERSRILIKDYKVEIYDCKNGHKINNILFSDFENTQKINEEKINCQICEKLNKNTSYKNNFFSCFECKKNICILCKTKHDKSHNIINYDDKFFTCDLHYESYISYCDNCKKDICMECEMEHSDHKIITYGSILPNMNKIKEEAKEFYNKKELFKKYDEDIIIKLNNLMHIIDDYVSIYKGIINSYENKKRNYFLLQNIKEITNFNDNFIEKMNKISQTNNIFTKLNVIINIYYKASEKNINKDKSSSSELNNNINNNLKVENELNEKNNININLPNIEIKNEPFIFNSNVSIIANSNSLDYDYLIKCILVGDADAGKLNMLKNFYHHGYEDKSYTILGAIINNKVYKIQIGDTVRNAKGIPVVHYKFCTCEFIVYNIGNRNTFDNISILIEQAKIWAPKTISFVLVGNYFNLEDKREVTYEEGKKFADKYGMKFFEVSSITGQNIYASFLNIFYEISKKIENGYYDSNGRKVGIISKDDKNVSLRIDLENEKADKNCIII